MHWWPLSPSPQFDRCLAIAPDGRSAWVGGGGGHVDGPSLVEIDLDRGSCTTLLSSRAHSVTRIAVSPDGTRLAAGQSDGQILVWRRDHPDDLVAIRSIESPAVGFVAAADGTVWTLSSDGSVRAEDSRIISTDFGPVEDCLQLPGSDSALLRG